MITRYHDILCRPPNDTSIDVKKLKFLIKTFSYRVLYVNIPTNIYVWLKATTPDFKLVIKKLEFEEDNDDTVYLEFQNLMDFTLFKLAWLG